MLVPSCPLAVVQIWSNMDGWISTHIIFDEYELQIFEEDEWHP